MLRTIQSVLVLGLCLCACVLQGCSTGPPNTTKALQFVGIVETGVTNLRTLEHGIATDTTATVDQRAKAAQIEAAAIQALPFITAAKDGLAAVGGDKAAQARIVGDLITKLAKSDPNIVALAEVLQTVLQELIAESQASTAAPAKPPGG